MRITAKGQVTIPIEIRQLAGLLPDTDVQIVYDGHDVRIVKTDSPRGRSRGERATARLWGSGGDSGMSTAEILSLMRDPHDDSQARLGTAS
jgi:bifunctional DNA-binding transcriptional regulator/antitoxin component of YhaV-PrlF toxin-antitoxin module